MTLSEIPLRLIRTESNVRSDLPAIDELAASIRALGVLSPITVERRAGAYIVLVGHRRTIAAKLAGLETIPAVVIGGQVSETQRVERQIAENTGRVALDPIDEARGFKKLRDAGKTIAQVAGACGVSVATVHSRLAQLDLPVQDQKRLRNGEITLNAAGQIAKLVRERRSGSVRHGRGPAHFGAGHPLHDRARSVCSHPTRPRLGGACGPCWEDTIRGDERARAMGGAA